MNNNTPSTCQLNPLEVPWMVSPSMPELSTRTSTIDGLVSGTVALNAFFGEGTSTAEKWGKYRRVKVYFENLVYLRLFPEFSVEDQQRIDSFDWSAVPEFRDESGGFAGSIERTRLAWNETMLCPSPSCYLLSNSDLISKLGLSVSEFRHFLFLGEDSSVEVIAKNWNWGVVEGNVPRPV